MPFDCTSFKVIQPSLLLSIFSSLWLISMWAYFRANMIINISTIVNIRLITRGRMKYIGRPDTLENEWKKIRSFGNGSYWIWRRERDSNPRRTCILAGFQDRCLQPTRPSLLMGFEPCQFTNECSECQCIPFIGTSFSIELSHLTPVVLLFPHYRFVLHHQNHPDHTDRKSVV